MVNNKLKKDIVNERVKKLKARRENVRKLLCNAKHNVESQKIFHFIMNTFEENKEGRYDEYR